MASGMQVPAIMKGANPRHLKQTAKSKVKGSVANSRGLAELLILDGNAGLCGEDGELLGEGRIWIEGESRLSFAHHVNHFDAG